MSVPDQETENFYIANGVTTVFPYGFYLLSEDDLTVSVDGVVQTSGYTVTGVGTQTGGTVIFALAPANQASVLLERSVTLERTTDYQPNGDLRSDVLNQDFDRIWMVLQDKKRENIRSIRYPNYENLDGLLPNAATRALHVLGFAANGVQTMLPMPATFGAGDLRYEVFTAGVNFTPGTTTQLTLARDPGTPDNVEVHFDGIFQGSDQWGVTGSTLSFTNPIPVGVGKVYVRSGTTLSVYVPPPRSVGDDELSWGAVLDRKVDSVAALRLLDGSRYKAAATRGYYAPNGMGAAEFDTDPTDTSSADNNGTIIVGADGTRWKMRPRAEVSAACFGVIPGVANVGARLNQALVDHKGKYRLLLPQGDILTGTVIVDIPAGSDVGGIGPVNSSYGPIISTAQHGTQIVSAVPSGFAVRIGYNTPVVAGGTRVGNFEIKNTAGKGLYCQSMGTGAIIHDIGVHDCAEEGAQFSYFQDSSLINLEVVNCGGGSFFGVKFDINCNACRVDKLLIVQCRQPLWVDTCTFFDFYNPHIEQGEYPIGDPNAVVNCAFIGGGFKFSNCQHINFYGGVYVPNSSAFLASFYSIAESATSFYLTTDAACKNIKMFGPKFSSPLKGSRFISANNIELIGPTFNNAVSAITAIEGTNVKIRDGQAELYDDQTQTAMVFGFFAGRSEVSDFEIVCSNPGAATKVSGALLDGVVDVGRYKVTVDKFFSHLGNNAFYRGPTGVGGVGYSLSGGTVDIQKQNAGDAVLINTISGALLSLNNYHGQGGKYTVVNNTGGNLTVGTGGNISTPSTITVPAFGSIDLKHIPGTTALSPVV